MLRATILFFIWDEGGLIEFSSVVLSHPLLPTLIPFFSSLYRFKHYKTKPISLLQRSSASVAFAKTRWLTELESGLWTTTKHAGWCFRWFDGIFLLDTVDSSVPWWSVQPGREAASLEVAALSACPWPVLVGSRLHPHPLGCPSAPAVVLHWTMLMNLS